MKNKYADITLFKIVNFKKCKVCCEKFGGYFSPRFSYKTFFLCLEGHRRELKKPDKYEKFGGQSHHYFGS